ncbi:MAG: DUF6020 family protein [Bacilli bacterium]|nr:DUF6020 family protein [Bacilli bacterium]
MKYKEKITCLLLAIISAFSLLIELDTKSVIKINGRSTINLTFLILGLFIYNLYKNYDRKQNYKGFNILAILFSVFMIFGYSYDKLDSWHFVWGNYQFILVSIIKLIGFYNFFNVCLHKFYEYIKKINFKETTHKIVNEFNKKPILYSAIIIFICWLPYIISFYPVILSPDPTNQIKQFFGIPTRYIDGIKLINKDVLLTNDNPFLHTVLLGGCVKMGHTLGSDNFGLFIYSIIQIVIFMSALLYSIKYSKKIKVPTIFTIIMLAIYSLVPLFPFYAMSAVKDVIFSSFMLIYVIKLFDLIKYNNYEKIDYIELFLLLLAICFSRNNGMYNILLSLPLVLIFLKESRTKIILILVSSLSLYLLFVNVGLPLLQVTEGNKREMFSLPFQQTARYVKYYGDDLTSEERKIINKVLIIDTLVDRYDPVKADPVKNGFNALSSDEDFSNYLKVWFRLFLRHPNVYIESTLNNIYGYFYPNTTKWYIYYKEYNTRLNETGIFNYHYNNLVVPRKILTAYGVSFPRIPIIGMFANIGFVVWLYLFMLVILIKEKLYKYITVLAPALSLILVCIASPVNTYFRYALPYVIALPITVCMLYKILKK